MPLPLHRIIVRILRAPFIWATMRQRQNSFTRLVRAAWRAL